MQPTRSLPQGYRPILVLDLSTNGPLLIWLNLAGLAILPLAGWFFLAVTARLRPEFSLSGWLWDRPGGALAKIVVLLAASVLVIILHELVHGAFFWLNTGQRAVYGFRGAYAFAGAPDWFIPRGRYLVVGLSPLVCISLAGILLIPWLPTLWLGALIVALLVNATGASGDLAVVAWLVLRGKGALVQDFGDALNVYAPGVAA
jgi:hypothetical protein